MCVSCVCVCVCTVCTVLLIHCAGLRACRELCQGPSQICHLWPLHWLLHILGRHSHDCVLFHVLARYRCGLFVGEGCGSEVCEKRGGVARRESEERTEEKCTFSGVNCGSLGWTCVCMCVRVSGCVCVTCMHAQIVYARATECVAHTYIYTYTHIHMHAYVHTYMHA